MAKASVFKWVVATAGGAVLGALAIRAVDKYLGGEKEKEKKQIEGDDQQPRQGPFALAPMMHPVYIPFPTSYAVPAAPMPPSIPPPGYREPIEVEAEERDVVSEIESEWDEEYA